jgi:hypothetical protein
MVDFSGSPLAWGILIFMGLSAIWGFWFWSRQFWRTKFGDPEWRKYADGWSWLGIGLLAAGLFAIFALWIAFIVLNAIWYLTH